MLWCSTSAAESRWEKAIVALREMVRELAEKGHKKIVLNLGGVHYVDSSGVGELVKTHTTLRNQGGQLKLTNLNKRVHDLLQMTRLSAVFDIQEDERERSVRSETRRARLRRFLGNLNKR